MHWSIQRLAFVALLGSLVGCVPSTQLVPIDVGGSSRLDDASKLVGEGRLSHEPQYLELTIKVHSECYRTPLAASEATDAAARRMMQLLRGKIDADNPKDGVFSSGGYTAGFQRYSDGITLCESTFQKTSTIVMKTSRVAGFSRDYQQIQQLVHAGSLRKLNTTRSDTPTTFATLSEPQPRLYHETRELLEQRALADALGNARDKFEATAAVACGDTKHRILKFVEASPDAARPIAYGRAEPSRGRGGAIELDAIWINKLLDVYFTVDACSG